MQGMDGIRLVSVRVYMREGAHIGQGLGGGSGRDRLERPGIA